MSSTAAATLPHRHTLPYDKCIEMDISPMCVQLPCTYDSRQLQNPLKLHTHTASSLIARRIACAAQYSMPNTSHHCISAYEKMSKKEASPGQAVPHQVPGTITAQLLAFTALANSHTSSRDNLLTAKHQVMHSTKQSSLQLACPWLPEYAMLPKDMPVAQMAGQQKALFQPSSLIMIAQHSHSSLRTNIHLLYPVSCQTSPCKDDDYTAITCACGRLSSTAVRSRCRGVGR